MLLLLQTMRKLILLAFLCLTACTLRAQHQVPDSLLHWQYTTGKDEMTGDVFNQAVIYSPDADPFATFGVLTKGKYITPTLHIEGGLIPSGTTLVEVKFDENPVELFSTEPRSDDMKSLAFLSGKGVMKRILKAHKMIIRIPVYQQGYVILHFNVEGFKTPGV